MSHGRDGIFFPGYKHGVLLNAIQLSCIVTRICASISLFFKNVLPKGEKNSAIITSCRRIEKKRKVRR